MALSTPAGTELSHDQLLKLYRDMLTQRAVDTRGFQLNRQGKIGIAMGSEGHEAVQAGTGLAFERGRDLLYPYYRNTGIILACGFPLVDLFRSQLARAVTWLMIERPNARTPSVQRGSSSTAANTIASCSVSSATARPRKASGTRRSTSPPCTRCRWCSCARTTSGRSRRTSANKRACR